MTEPQVEVKQDFDVEIDWEAYDKLSDEEKAETDGYWLDLIDEPAK